MTPLSVRPVELDLRRVEMGRSELFKHLFVGEYIVFYGFFSGLLFIRNLRNVLE